MGRLGAAGAGPLGVERWEGVDEGARAQGLGNSEGKPPAATLYSAILRECQTKGGEARLRDCRTLLRR